MSIFKSEKTSVEIQSKIAELTAQQASMAKEIEQLEQTYAEAIVTGKDEESKAFRELSAVWARAKAVPRALEVLQQELATAKAREAKRSLEAFLVALGPKRRKVEKMTQDLAETMKIVFNTSHAIGVETSEIVEGFRKAGAEAVPPAVAPFPNFGGLRTGFTTTDAEVSRMVSEVASLFDSVQRIGNNQINA